MVDAIDERLAVSPFYILMDGVQFLHYNLLP